mmetsp:Transcript_9931/g.12354  ORF Transcript_9931/g.12354 Transcript_9931/m.12354 type:complete len:120 (+) Transcript_9931:1699-2058(+)
MKASQQIPKKMLGVSFPVSLNQTQSVRFVPGSNKATNAHVPTIPNYSAGGPLTSSTNQSGMNSTTHPNAHLIFAESSQTSQSHFVNTATIPLIKNGEHHGVEKVSGAYTNTQMLDRIFN